MSVNVHNIIPGEGLGDIKFGMSQSEIMDLIGPPIEKEIFRDEDDPNLEIEAWHYDEVEMSLGFEKIDDFKLVNIAASSPMFEFKKKKLIGLNKEKLILTLDAIGLNEFLLEEVMVDEDEKVAVYRSNETGLTFFLDNDVLSEILITVIEDENEQIIWPN